MAVLTWNQEIALIACLLFKGLEVIICLRAAD